MNIKSRQQPVTDKCGNQTHQQNTDQSKTSALYHPASEPSGNNANDNDNQETLTGQMHDLASSERVAGQCASMIIVPLTPTLLARSARENSGQLQRTRRLGI